MLRHDMEEAVKAMIGESRYDTIVPIYLDLAQQAVVNRLFPMDGDADWTMVPEAFHIRTCEIAVYLINKRGAEGEVAHRENGTSRSYGSAGIPSALFAGMVPFARVPKKAEL